MAIVADLNDKMVTIMIYSSIEIFNGTFTKHFSLSNTHKYLYVQVRM